MLRTRCSSRLGSCNPAGTSSFSVPAHCVGAELIFYCPIDQADVNNDGRVNSIDLGMTASQFFVLPVSPQFDQNFDGVLNSIDLGSSPRASTSS